MARSSAILLAALCAAAGASAQAPARPKDSSPPRVDLRPQLVPGQVFRYRIQLQTVTNTKRTGAIADPQGPAQLAVTWGATVKLEVLGDAAPAPANPAPSSVKVKSAGSTSFATPLRIRTTYEQSAANVKSDSPEPDAENIEQRYNRLDGQILEFSVGTDGHVYDVKGLQNVLDDDQVRQAAEQWMLQVSRPAVSPQAVAIGQSWNSAQPAGSMPLAGIVWRSTSTYLRDEPCRPADRRSASETSPEICAVILTRQTIAPDKQLRDPTPDEYRRNGLRTAGHWNGSGESLSYLSLQAHTAVSVTQDSSQQIDFTVTNSSGNSIRYSGTIETHSRVELLPPDQTGSP